MRPLEGLRVLVTRPADQAGPFVAELEELGAVPILLPVIEIAPPDDRAPLRDAVSRLEEFDWVVLTSVNGVKAVLDAMEETGTPVSTLSARRIAVIGPATANRLEELVRKPDVVPKEYVAEAILDSLPPVSGLRFLLPRADLARPELAEMLTAAGALVTSVVAYQIVKPAPSLPVETPPPDVITLTSGSAAVNTISTLQAQGREDWLHRATLACIGPVTERALNSAGFRADVVAEEYTAPGLIRALVQHEEKRRARV